MKSFSSMVVLVLALAAFLTAEVSGKAVKDDISQAPDMTEVVEVDPGDSPCVYKGRFFTIDVRDILGRFKGKNFSVDNGRYVYSVSFCSPIFCICPRCSALPEDLTNAAACQYVSSQKRYVKLGDSSSVKFNVANLTSFNMVFTGGNHDDDGDISRQLQVNFEVVPECAVVPTLEFTREDVADGSPEVHTYIFTVRLGLSEEKLLSFHEKIEP